MKHCMQKVEQILEISDFIGLDYQKIKNGSINLNKQPNLLN